MAIDWLNRKAGDNPTGLNPEDNGKTDDSRAPIYLQTIEEQDFMTQDGDNFGWYRHRNGNEHPRRLSKGKRWSYLRKILKSDCSIQHDRANIDVR